MEDLTKLFQIGDQEQKGFLIRRDMQRLQGELSLSADQLEAVFDSLDSESQGYLTLDKFLLGYSQHRAALKNNINNNNNTEEDEKDLLIPNEISSYIHDLSSSMFISKNTIDNLKSIGSLISYSEGSGSNCDSNGGDNSNNSHPLYYLLDKLLYNFNEDIKKINSHIYQLETIINTKDIQNEHYIQKLYDEIEIQIKQEKDEITNIENNKYNNMKLLYDNQINNYQNEIKNLNIQNNQLINKLNYSINQENQYKLLIKNLACDQEVYANQIENLQKSTLELQNELENMKAQTEAKCNDEYKRGFRTAQIKATFEEDSFIQQLKILRNMQTILSSDHIDQLAAAYNFKKKSSV